MKEAFCSKSNRKLVPKIPRISFGNLTLHVDRGGGVTSYQGEPHELSVEVESCHSIGIGGSSNSAVITISGAIYCKLRQRLTGCGAIKEGADFGNSKSKSRSTKEKDEEKEDHGRTHDQGEKGASRKAT